MKFEAALKQFGAAFLSYLNLENCPVANLRLCLCLSAALLVGCGEQASAPTTEITATTPVVPTTGCGARATPISQVQGEGAQSPLFGKSVSIEAVVTFAPVSELGGIFVQEEREDRDGEPSTSEGLFITTDAAKTAKPGDVVRVSGMVNELGDAGKTVTALTDLSEFRVCGQAKLPTEAGIERPPIVAADWERYEAMRVRLDLPVTVIRNDSLRHSGAVLVSLTGRQYAPTQLFTPGEEARKLDQDNRRSRIWLDDASVAHYPEKISWLPSAVNHETPYRLGTRLGEVGGIMDEREGGYRIHVLQAPVAEQVPRPKSPAKFPGELRVASFNMLNWFNGDGKKGGFPTERGASDPADAERQRQKLIAAIIGARPDIAGLMEVENDGDEKLNALSELVNELNRQSGLGYAIVNPPEPKVGGDLIRVAMIYRARVVQTKGAAAVLTGPPFDNYNRVPMAQSFQQGKNGGVFTLVVNHFKSKSCSGADEANADRGDGQACFNAKRVEAARALLEWMKTDPTGSGDPDQLIIGDLNAYAKEDPVRLMTEAGFMDVFSSSRGEPHYSFAYDGMLGGLDHALASDTLKLQVQGVDVWHINADEFPGFAYHSDITPRAADAEAPDAATRKREAATRALLYRKHAYRSSDHDPLIVYLTLEK